MNELLFIGIAHALFTIIFVASRERKNLCDRILIAWMIMLTLPLLWQAFGPAGADILVSPFDRDFAYSFCLGPFLWLYVKCLTGDIERIRPRHFIHFAPFIGFVVFKLIAGEVTIAVDSGTVWPQYIGFANIILLICYSAAVIWRLKKHSHDILDNFSSLTSPITLKWLVWLAGAFILAYITPLLAFVFSLPQWLQSHATAFTGFIFFLSFFGLKQTQIFNADSQGEMQVSPQVEVDQSGIAAKTEAVQFNEEEKKAKYERSGLTDALAKTYLNRVQSYILSQRPYLDANLTVDKLAAQVHIPRHYLTQIFSEQLNKNFYLYINEYRIENVKAMLADPKNRDMTLLDLAYASGFNSKSTFNSVFKKLTHLTPSQFKKRQSV